MRATAVVLADSAKGPEAETRCRDFERLWDQHRERVWRLVARLSGNLEAADDLTQEVGLRALQAFTSFRSESAFFTWLYRIAVHVVIRWRDGNRETPLTLDSPAAGDVAADAISSPEFQAANDALRTAVWDAMERLPEELRVTLILRVFEDLSYREIARILEIPVGTVMSRLHAARRRMREELKDHEM